jgi:hypothetical protein
MTFTRSVGRIDDGARQPRQGAWITADLTRRGQPRGKGILGGGEEPVIRTSENGILPNPVPG